MYMIANEIKVSSLMNPVIGAPKIYGCVYDVSNFGQEHVYIAFEKMDTHLLDTTFREYIRQLK